MDRSPQHEARGRQKTLRYLGSLINVFDLPVLLTDGKLRILQANEPALTLFQYSAAELADSSLELILGDADSEELTAHLVELIDGRGIWQDALACRRKDDSTFEALLRIEPLLPDPDGLHLRLCRVEIRSRPEIAQWQSLSDSAFRQLVEHRGEVFFRRTLDGSFYYVTPSIKALLGITPEEALGPLELLLSDHPMNQAYRRALESGRARWDDAPDSAISSPQPYTIEMKHQHGGFILVQVHESPVLDASDRIIAFQGVAATQSVTDHAAPAPVVAKDHSLSASVLDSPESALSRLEPLLEQLDLAVLTFNRQGEIDFWNRACEILHRQTRKQVQGKRLDEALADCCGQVDFAQAVERLFAEQEMERLDCAGGDRTLAFWLFPLFDQAGEIEAGMAFQLELAAGDFQAQERGLVEFETSMTIQELAGSLGNDFNGLLSAITGYAGLMQSQLPEEDVQHNYLNLILQASCQATKLTQQLLSFSSDTNYQVAPVNLNNVVHESMGRIRRLLPPGARVRCQLAPNLPSFEGNRQQVEQALLNLCVNAGEALDQRGTVTVETYQITLREPQAEGEAGIRPGRYVALRVSDTGCGIPENLRDKVLRPYFSTRSRQRGMGLAAVAGIVKQHYGYLDLQSAPGAGTQFSLSFPVEWFVERAELSAEGGEGLPSALSATVLLIDDNRTFRQAARQMIELMGNECLEAVNGLEGVRAYARYEERIDVVLLDMMMPIMSGRETFECLRAINPDVKVIFSSGFDIQHIVHRMEIGPEARYLQKPYTLRLLHKKIDEALGRIPAGGSPAGDLPANDSPAHNS